MEIEAPAPLLRGTGPPEGAVQQDPGPGGESTSLQPQRCSFLVIPMPWNRNIPKVLLLGFAGLRQGLMLPAPSVLFVQLQQFGGELSDFFWGGEGYQPYLACLFFFFSKSLTGILLLTNYSLAF